jgi:hypothetical protein
MAKDYHGKGEQDARDEKYERPHGVLDDLTTWTKSGMERNERENRQYDDGYHHGRGQQDASRDEYHKPHGMIDDLTTWSKSGMEKNERENDAYDSGHSSTSEQKSGGCFLTTACVEAAGLPDACHELTVLRRFRDTYVARLPEGGSMISEYNAVAPLLVARIESAACRARILRGILADVRRAVVLIEAGEHAAALTLYRAMLARLRARFSLNDNCS